MTARRYKVSRARFCDLARGFKRRLAKLLPGSEVTIEWSSDAASGDVFVTAQGSCAPGMPFGEAVRRAGGRFLTVAQLDGEGVLEPQGRDLHNVDFVRATWGAR